MKENHSFQTFTGGRNCAAALASHHWMNTRKLDLKTYHSPPHPCHPGSLSPHRTGISLGCSACRRRSDARSSWFFPCSPVHQTGLDTATSHHTPEPQGCTSSRGNTETHLGCSTNKRYDYLNETALQLIFKVPIYSFCILCSNFISFCVLFWFYWLV